MLARQALNQRRIRTAGEQQVEDHPPRRHHPVLQPPLALGHQAALEGLGKIRLRSRAVTNFTIGDTRHKVIASIEIEDDGPGIAPDRREALLQRGVRGDERVEIFKRESKVEADARDAKTMLQEWAQARGMPPPVYAVLGRSGPDHAPVFEIEARLENGSTAKGRATSKRAAQQGAAQSLLDKLEQDT